MIGILFLARAPKSLEFPNGSRRQAAFAHHNDLLTIPGKPEGFGVEVLVAKEMAI